MALTALIFKITIYLLQSCSVYVYELLHCVPLMVKNVIVLKLLHQRVNYSASRGIVDNGALIHGPEDE